MTSCCLILIIDAKPRDHQSVIYRGKLLILLCCSKFFSKCNFSLIWLLIGQTFDLPNSYLRDDMIVAILFLKRSHCSFFETISYPWKKNALILKVSKKRKKTLDAFIFRFKMLLHFYIHRDWLMTILKVLVTLLLYFCCRDHNVNFSCDAENQDAWRRKGMNDRNHHHKD